jgi:hypothetical protein
MQMEWNPKGPPMDVFRHTVWDPSLAPLSRERRSRNEDLVSKSLCAIPVCGCLLGIYHDIVIELG